MPDLSSFAKPTMFSFILRKSRLNSKKQPTRDIVFIEPRFDAYGHESLNAEIILAFSEAGRVRKVWLCCSADYWRLLGQVSPRLIDNPKIEWVKSTPRDDSDSSFRDFFRRLRELMGLSRYFSRLAAGELILFSAYASGPMLSATQLLGGLKLLEFRRSFFLLHGNLNDINEWQSRNPVRRAIQLSASLKRGLSSGRPRFLVLEEYIQSNLGAKSGFSSRFLDVLLYPVVPGESQASLRVPFKDREDVVLYVGLATDRKGFPEFLKLAEACSKHPGLSDVKFSAVGRKDAKAQYDQSRLREKLSDDHVSRDQMLRALRAAKFVFLWLSDYYDLCASGTFLDAISHAVPVLTRGSRLETSEQSFQRFGIQLNSIDDASRALEDFFSKPNDQQSEIWNGWSKALSEECERRSFEELTKSLESMVGDA